MASAAHEVHTGAMREGVPRAPEGGRVPPSHPASHPTGTRFRRLAPVFVACRGCGRRLGRRSQLDRVAAARSVSVAKYVARLLHVEIVEASASRSPTSTFEVQAGGRWVSATAAYFFSAPRNNQHHKVWCDEMQRKHAKRPPPVPLAAGMLPPFAPTLSAARAGDARAQFAVGAAYRDRYRRGAVVLVCGRVARAVRGAGRPSVTATGTAAAWRWMRQRPCGCTAWARRRAT